MVFLLQPQLLCFPFQAYSLQKLFAVEEEFEEMRGKEVVVIRDGTQA